MTLEKFSVLMPSSDWTPPAELPDLSTAKSVVIDVETKDPDLKAMQTRSCITLNTMLGGSDAKDLK